MERIFREIYGICDDAQELFGRYDDESAVCEAESALHREIEARAAARALRAHDGGSAPAVAPRPDPRRGATS
ncbi:hypothetical protein [Gordonibacter pamelaeae]|uniref:hypothetical protein n=1 Tax=Gordonibacter pamelaeae TaxID=471189 RepID=UPI001D0741B5|nr:hypothetical protein [Gordonibacter pamelaeae]MCB6313608.1 hypothetical protein [Gordonibacter pamelaeae]